MKRRIVGVAFAVMVVLGGCGGGENAEKKEPSANHQENDVAPEKEDTEDDKEEMSIRLYYIDEESGATASKDVTIQGELSEEIVNGLKQEKVLSDTCELENLTENESDKTLDIDMNSGFGDYIRGMGTSGCEQVLECFVKSYLDAYQYTGVKITEQGEPLDTGHTVLDGYISYE